MSLGIKSLIRMNEIEAFYRLHRRYVLSELLHNSRHLFEELAFRMQLEIELIYNLLPMEIRNFLIYNKKPDIKLIKKRLNYFVLKGKNNKIDILYGKKAKNLIKKELSFQVDKDLKILKGKIGCKGKVSGIAKIVKEKKDFSKIKKGDILVTHETTPDFMPIFNKIKAIVTDEGGVTSHAAVISREMKIPCIIGTSIGTKVIKDNEKIEVNALRGYVKRLKFSKHHRRNKNF